MPKRQKHPLPPATDEAAQDTGTPQDGTAERADHDKHIQHGPPPMDQETPLVPEAADAEDEPATRRLAAVRPQAEPEVPAAGDGAPALSEQADLEEQPLAIEVPLAALTALSGPHDGMVATITSVPYAIGRYEADVHFNIADDQWVSRHHALLTYRNGQWWLQDTHSANGTWVGDPQHRLVEGEECPITLGMEFRVGHTELLLTNDKRFLA